MRFSVSCDFDGTITLVDTVDALLEQFAAPGWLDVEAQWQAGKLGSRECLAEQTKLLRMTPGDLDAWLDEREVDEDVAGFFADCGRMGIPVSVVSDGYDWVIRRILFRMGLYDTPITANRLIWMGDDCWTARFPFSQPSCGSGVCKCSVVGAQASLVHIGDGRSDICVSNAADIVFAKGHLLDVRNRLGLESVPFERFSEVRAMLPHLSELAPLPAQRIA